MNVLLKSICEILWSCLRLFADVNSHLVDSLVAYMPDPFRIGWLPLSFVLLHLQCLSIPFLQVVVLLINILLKSVLPVVRHSFYLWKWGLRIMTDRNIFACWQFLETAKLYLVWLVDILILWNSEVMLCLIILFHRLLLIDFWNFRDSRRLVHFQAVHIKSFIWLVYYHLS